MKQLYGMVDHTDNVVGDPLYQVYAYVSDVVSWGPFISTRARSSLGQLIVDYYAD